MTNIAAFTPSVKESVQFFNKGTALSVAKKMALDEKTRIEITNPVVNQVFNDITQAYTLPEVLSTIVWTMGLNYVAKFYEEYIQGMQDVKYSLESVLEYDSKFCVDIINKSKRKEFKKLDSTTKAEACIEILEKHINFANDCKETPQSPSCKKLKENAEVLEKSTDYKKSLEKSLEKIDTLSKSISQLKNTPPLLELFTLPTNINKRAFSIACQRMNFKPSLTKRGISWGVAGLGLSHCVTSPWILASQGLSGISVAGKTLWSRVTATSRT